MKPEDLYSISDGKIDDGDRWQPKENVWGGGERMDSGLWLKVLGKC